MSQQLTLKALFSYPEHDLDTQISKNPAGMQVLKRLAIAYMADTANMLDETGKRTLDATVPLKLVEQFYHHGLTNTVPEKRDRIAEYYRYVAHHSKMRQDYVRSLKEANFDKADNSVLVGRKLIVNKIYYAGFSAVLLGENDERLDKVVYFHQWPSVATIPPVFYPSLPEECKFDEITREEAVAFWSSQMKKQDDGYAKCGSWGLDNLPLTTTNWKGVNGLFIGDLITVTEQFKGILSKEKGDTTPLFTPYDKIQENSTTKCHSVNVHNLKTGTSFRAFASNDPQPQHANDVHMYWNSPYGLLTKVNKRGNEDTVDMQNKLMFGGGEHLTSTESILMSYSFKSSVVRNILEELSVPIEDLKNALFFDLGMFTSPGRDPRYFTYLYNGKYFGVPRVSRTHAVALYLEGNAQPRTVRPFDSVEVVDMPKGKHFLDVNTFLEHPEMAMIPDHMTILERALFMIQEIITEGKGDREVYKLANQIPNLEDEARKVMEALEASH